MLTSCEITNPSTGTVTRFKCDYVNHDRRRRLWSGITIYADGKREDMPHLMTYGIVSRYIKQAKNLNYKVRSGYV